EDALTDLLAALQNANRAPSAVAALAAMAHAYRAFAKRFPRLYPLLFVDRKPTLSPSAGTVAAVQPLLQRLTTIVGPDEILPAARLLVSFLHGFVSMEIAGAFRLGGNVDEAFAFGLSTALRGLNATTTRSRGKQDPGA